MFIDEAEIYVKAGKGGDGAVSFRREKYVPKGGPDGGDGGKGGDIIVVVDNHCHGLAQYNREKRFIARNGQPGMGSNKHGKNAEDLILRVPAGTQIYHNDELLFDFTKEGEEVILAKGGNGGWGNQHFATSIKQAPKWSKTGLKGESKKLRLELKTIADVGLIGLPNAGKSTLLSVLSNARPKIADYPFTTLEPNLGALKNIDKNIVIADIPGLIEGAAEGRGLGDKFLRHIERTKILVHLIDVNSDDLIRDYKTIRNELKKFSKELTKKPEIVVLNKSDILSEADLVEKIKILQKNKIKSITISAATNKGLDKLIEVVKSRI
jgi:GTP-binding protein